MALFGKNKEAKKEEIKETEKAERTAALPQGKEAFVYKTIEKPIVTERAVNLSHQGRYVFKVFPKANKVEIKRAIEKLYGVKVTGVRIINVISKKRQVGRFQGLRPGFKKAVVSVEKGQTIEITHS